MRSMQSSPIIVALRALVFGFQCFHGDSNLIYMYVYSHSLGVKLCLSRSAKHTERGGEGEGEGERTSEMLHKQKHYDCL